MGLFDDDDGYWAKRLALTPDQLQQMQAQAADQARQTYADQTQAMASDPSAGDDEGSADGAGEDKFRTAYQAQLDSLTGASADASGGSPPQPPSATQPAAAPQTLNPAHMSVSDRGLNLITSYEKFKPTAYVDGDPGHTIGWGHKILPGESFPSGVNQDQAETLLRNDLGDAQAIVRSHVKVPLTQNQFDALVSLAYNSGSAPFLPGNAIPTALNNGDYAGAARGFGLWIKSHRKVGGPLVVDQGLINRRRDEANLFLGSPGS